MFDGWFLERAMADSVGVVGYESAFKVAIIMFTQNVVLFNVGMLVVVSESILTDCGDCGDIKCP